MTLMIRTNRYPFLLQLPSHHPSDHFLLSLCKEAWSCTNIELVKVTVQNVLEILWMSLYTTRVIIRRHS
jgi:hypothetical protein